MKMRSRTPEWVHGKVEESGWFRLPNDRERGRRNAPWVLQVQVRMWNDTLGEVCCQTKLMYRVREVQ